MSTTRTILITGAAGGIGSEIVDRFLRNGDVVFAVGGPEDDLGTWRSRWDGGTEAETSSLRTFTTDVTDEHGLSELAATLAQLTDHLDVIITGAGYFPQTRFEDMTLDEWRRVIDVNLTGTFLTIKALLPLLKASERGRILNIGSGSVFSGTPMQAHYIAAKAGVMGLTRVLAHELGSYGITVNLLTPGLTITPAAAHVLPEQLLETQRRARALQRDETPDDLVGAAFFITSDDAAFITGQTINVDGGRHMVV